MKLNTQHVFTVTKSFEKIRAAGRQNDLLAKTNFVMHEKTSK